MKWLPRSGDSFDMHTEGMSRPAAIATMVLAEFAVIALTIKGLLDINMAFLSD